VQAPHILPISNEYESDLSPALNPFKGFGWLDFAGKEPIEEVNYVNWSTIKNLRFPQFSPQFDWSKAQRVSGATGLLANWIQRSNSSARDRA
jgi:hypothetical protein